MTAEERRQDPQDKAFGARAARDADVVDRVAEEQGDSAAPDSAPPAPRAAGKAEPEPPA